MGDRSLSRPGVGVAATAVRGLLWERRKSRSRRFRPRHDSRRLQSRLASLPQETAAPLGRQARRQSRCGARRTAERISGAGVAARVAPMGDRSLSRPGVGVAATAVRGLLWERRKSRSRRFRPRHDSRRLQSRLASLPQETAAPGGATGATPVAVRRTTDRRADLRGRGRGSRRSHGRSIAVTARGGRRGDGGARSFVGATQVAIAALPSAPRLPQAAIATRVAPTRRRGASGGRRSQTSPASSWRRISRSFSRRAGLVSG